MGLHTGHLDVSFGGGSGSIGHEKKDVNAVCRRSGILYTSYQIMVHETVLCLVCRMF
jgi:hypothetical protein